MPGDARGEPGAHGAGRAGLTALRTGLLPDVRGQLHSGWGGTVPRARFRAAAPAGNLGSASAKAAEVAQGCSPPRPCAPESFPVHAASEPTSQLRASVEMEFLLLK